MPNLYYFFIFIYYSQVFAIEASGVSRLCEEIIAHNGFEDKITVIHGCAEDVTLPNGVKADILISEWMGFYLLHESMLNSVITARDKFLDVDGIMVPSSATLYLCPVSMNKLYDDKFRYWNKVFGFDFAPVVPHIKHKVLSSPQIEVITKDQCLADPEEVLHIDLKYVESEEICNVMNHSRFNLSKNGLLHGLACWFDVEFEGDKPCLLSTGPNSEPTHWKQTVVLLPDALLVNRGDELQCKFLLEQSAHHPRRYNISIEIPEDDDESEEDLETAADRIMSAMNDGHQTEHVT